MSDFDKEAERERLREKYETEAADRETTQQMSELLLRGATMTNKHCPQCSNPVFRYEGQEFCPTCQSEDGQAGQSESNPASQPAGSTPSATESTPAPQPGQSAQSSPDPQPGQSAQSTPFLQSNAQPSPQQSGPEHVEQPTETTGQQSTPADAAPSAPTGSDTESIATARASLARTLLELTQRAEQTDDVRLTRERLEAARVAAEAIAALE